MANNKFRTLAKRIFLMKVSLLGWSIIKEYGVKWIIFRLYYSFSQKLGIRAKLIPERQYEDFKSTIKIPEIEEFKYILTNNFIDMDLQSFLQYQKTLNQMEKQVILKRADKVNVGIINGFGKLELDYGNPVSWFKNPINGQLFNSTNHWSYIPDFGETGDIKIGWEISRFHFVYDLIKAHAITEDVKYYYTFINLFEDWILQNPPEKGINWKCSQEISIRLLSITYGLRYFCDFYTVKDKIIENFFLLVDASLDHIFANKNYALKSIKNDHAFVEMFALYIFGGLFKSTKYKKYREFGAKHFERQIIEQIYEDGGYKQNSFNYHRLILQITAVYMHQRKQYSNELSEHFNKSIIFLNSAIMNEEGTVPNFGPSDSAMVFLYSNDINNFRKTLNLCNFLLNGKVLYDEPSDFEEICWFSNCGIYEKEIDKVKSSFNISGYWYFNRDKWKVFFRAGRQWHRPFHDDMMHIDIWHSGTNVLCDMGTYSYNFNLEESEYFNSNKAHNTLEVLSTNKFTRIGKFLIVNWKHAQNISKSDCSIYAEQYFDKHTLHRRRITIVSDEIVIEDKVNSIEVKTISITFNSCFTDIQRYRDDIFHLRNMNDDIFELSFTEYPQNSVEFIIVSDQKEDSALGWYSDSYLKRKRGIHISLNFECEKEFIVKSKLKKIN